MISALKPVKAITFLIMTMMMMKLFVKSCIFSKNICRNLPEKTNKPNTNTTSGNDHGEGHGHCHGHGHGHGKGHGHAQA